MNKKARRRAFFICAAIFVMYVIVGLNLTEKLSMKRIADKEGIQAKPMGLIPAKAIREQIPAPVAAVTPAAAAVSPKSAALTEPVSVPYAAPAPVTPVKPLEQKAAAPAKPESAAAPKETILPVTAFLRDGVTAEPGFLMAPPIVCYALRAGLIEREGLIFIKKGGYNNPSWKKPLDILKDRDEEGLRSISRAIGKKQILAFLKKEGIIQKEEPVADDLILGRGYSVEKKKLLSLYDRHVSADYQNVFPFFLDHVGIAKGKNGFEVVRPKDGVKERREEGEEWMMPNLTNLTIREAISKISPKTSKIQVFGSGNVTDQQPKPFQRSQGEVECIIYGRTSR